MANNKKISTTELDFDAIKNNLKTFLSGQTEFQDAYDFEGSGLSIMLDVLAYNTHYNALYNNLAVNEIFLDSASKRDSVVSLAKMLGYLPKSATSATAIVDVVVNTQSGGITLLTLPAFSSFSTKVDGVSYTFYNDQTYTATGNSIFTFSNVKLIEGIPLKNSYPVTDGVRFIIPNANADLTTLQVKVQESVYSSVYETYTLATDLSSVNDQSKIYFIKEIDSGLYELTFGDDVNGKRLNLGNVVHVDYFVSNLEAANSSRLFLYTGSTLVSGSKVSVNTISPASGGSAPEDIDSIKFNAPKYYASQNRAVTTEDYKTLIYSNFSNVNSVSVWGGDENVPPVYGKVFICIKPNGDQTALTTLQKQQVLDGILASKNVVSVIPEIVDADVLDILLTSTVYFNEKETNRSFKEVESIVIDTIINYNDTDLQKFDSIFRNSKLLRLIDASERGITNSNISIKLRRLVTPKFNVSSEYTINIANPILISPSKVPEEAVVSNGFYILGSNEIHYIDDDGDKALRLFTKNADGTKNVLNPNFGTVDKKTGILKFRELNITLLAEQNLYFYIKPQFNDVVSAFSQVVNISSEDLSVNVISDGSYLAGQNYKFTA
jgi:hypothetical protein